MTKFLDIAARIILVIAALAALAVLVFATVLLAMDSPFILVGITVFALIFWAMERTMFG